MWCEIEGSVKINLRGRGVYILCEPWHSEVSVWFLYHGSSEREYITFYNFSNIRGAAGIKIIMRIKGKINTFRQHILPGCALHSLVSLYCKYFYSKVIDATNTHIYGTIRKNAFKKSVETYLLTYSMVQSPSWKANWFAASQEIPRISRNPKVHYRTHKRPPIICILGQPNLVHIPTSHLLEIHPNIIHPSTPRSPQ